MGGDSVQLYALVDLDASTRLASIWLALGPNHVAVAREAGAGGDETIRIFSRSEIRRVREIPELSCTTLIIEAEPDRAYAEAVAFPVREAQASVAENRLAIVWRLLSYLKPYRTRVTLGLIGATLMTFVSLVPPYLTGRLIDKVLPPFEEGSPPWEQARQVAWITLGGLVCVYLLREGVFDPGTRIAP